MAQTAQGMPRLAVAVLGLSLALALAACRGHGFAPSAQADGHPTLKITEIQVGRAVSTDKRVEAATDVFSPEDIIYTSVTTEGSSANATLRARWSYGHRLLAESTQQIAPQGIAISEFHVWKPGGWPPGSYQVEVFVDDLPVGARRFQVR